MNATHNRLRLSDIEFARLGGGHLAYIREIDAEKASVLLGETPAELPARSFAFMAPMARRLRFP